MHCVLRRYAGEHQLLIPSDLKSCYFLMISAYVPRPIALVSSLSASGVGNVAPYRSWPSVTPTLAHIFAVYGPSACVSSLRLCFSLSLSLSPSTPTPHARADTFNARAQNIARNSYSGCVAHDPPTLVVSCCRRPDGSVKDTCLNALATKEFVVNIMSDWAVEAQNHTCANFAPDQVEG